MAAETSLRPSKAWMVRMSVPCCGRWVAKLCRKVRAPIFLVNPARRAAELIALLMQPHHLADLVQEFDLCILTRQAQIL